MDTRVQIWLQSVVRPPCEPSVKQFSMDPMGSP